MAFSSKDFMEYIHSNSGLAEGFRYRVHVDESGAQANTMLEFMCQEAVIPGKEIEVMDKVYGYGSVYTLPKMEKYEDVSLKFKCTNGTKINGRWGYPEWTFFYEWMEQIVHSMTNKYNYKSEYQRDTFIETLDNRGDIIHMVKLPSAYPTKISDMTLTTEQKEMEFEVTLTCDFVLHNDHAMTGDPINTISGNNYEHDKHKIEFPGGSRYITNYLRDRMGPRL